MPYATGGYAKGRFEFNAQNLPPGTTTEQAATRSSGWYVGGGLDWAVLNNLILGVEYRHYVFGDRTAPSSATPSGFTESITFSGLRTDAVMARASWKFNGPWPVP
jgi:outer membrane immunogenic protein